MVENPVTSAKKNELAKRKKTSILDIEENTEIEKVIRLEQILKIWKRSYYFEI